MTAICLLNALALMGGIAPSLATNPPDIVVILTDDMRADDWRILDDTQRLVGGTWFPNFVYNTPLCCPFRASFQRGQMAHNTGIENNNDGSKFTALDDDTIATALHDAGYHTAYVGKYMNEYTGQPPGWDDWQGDDGTDAKSRYYLDGTYVTTLITTRALAAIAAAPAEQPLFLMIGHDADHDPWPPEAKYANADVGPTRNADDAARKRTLLSVDDSTEAIAAALGDRWDNAVVLVASDNGYLLGEHDTTGKSIWWDEVSRCPVLLRAPGIPAGTDLRMISTVDLPATLLRAAGAEMRHPLDGRPLQDSWQREGVLIESWDKKSAGNKRLPFTAIRGDGWVYVEAQGKAPQYYLLADGESVDHYGELAADKQQRLAAWLADLRDCHGAECG